MNKRFFFLSVLLLLFYNLSSAEELLPKEAVNYFNEGVKAQKDGDFYKATIAYKKTLLLDPGNIDWQKFITNNSGIMYAQNGDLDNAEAAFNEILATDPNYMPAKLNLGIIYDMRGNRLKSLEYWAKMFNLDALKPKAFIIEEQRK